MLLDFVVRAALLPVKWSTCAVVVGFATALIVISFLM